MVNKKCPLCGKDNFKIKYEKNYSVEKLKPNLFSARRERKKSVYEHDRFVKCKDCGMVYANPIIKPELLAKLYKKSKFNYGKEEENLKKSYRTCLKRVTKYVKDKKRILDVGTGNGFFLDEAIKEGYKETWGIEPSNHAAQLANKKNKIIVDILKEGQFKKDYFDTISLFQVIDHIADPKKVINICRDYLKKEGIIICVSHNVDSLSAKILGEKSPIFDIEHTQLFSKKTISKLFKLQGFEILELFEMTNTYTLDYWITATPLPFFIKKNLKKILNVFDILEKPININPGNFGIIVKKDS